MKKSKRYNDSLKGYDSIKKYEPKEAIELLGKMPKGGYDQTIEMNINLGIDPKQADQQLRGTIILPQGTGNKKKIAAICKDPGNSQFGSVRFGSYADGSGSAGSGSCSGSAGSGSDRFRFLPVPVHIQVDPLSGHKPGRIPSHRGLRTTTRTRISRLFFLEGSRSSQIKESLKNI